MKEVSVRDFSLHPSKYIKKLPIILTRYNLPIATIVPYKELKPVIGIQDIAPFPHTLLHTKVMEAIKQEEQSGYPTTLYGKPLSGKKGTCPVCGEVAPVEFATKHYTDKHEDL